MKDISEHVEIEDSYDYNGTEEEINHGPYFDSNEEIQYESASVIDKSHQNERVKSLSASETKKVLEEILRSYDKCEGSTKLFMG